MMTWKSGGTYGQVQREIVSEDEGHVIARVITKCYASYRPAINPTRPWPKGERNFRLILNAPKTMEALEEIAEGAIVSSDQPPEKIAEQILRVLQIARESAAEYMIYASRQQQRAERAEAALEAIVKLDPPVWCGQRDEVVMDVCEQCKEIARAAIAAVKGEGDDNIG